MQYDIILLVGDSTFMQQVRKRLTEELPDIPIEFFEPECAVSKGAAIWGNQLKPIFLQ